MVKYFLIINSEATLWIQMYVRTSVRPIYTRVSVRLSFRLSVSMSVNHVYPAIWNYHL